MSGMSKKSPGTSGAFLLNGVCLNLELELVRHMRLPLARPACTGANTPITPAALRFGAQTFRSLD
jgi:hypothetical protein